MHSLTDMTWCRRSTVHISAGTAHARSTSQGVGVAVGAQPSSPAGGRGNPPATWQVGPDRLLPVVLAVAPEGWVM